MLPIIQTQTIYSISKTYEVQDSSGEEVAPEAQIEDGQKKRGQVEEAKENSEIISQLPQDATEEKEADNRDEGEKADENSQPSPSDDDTSAHTSAIKSRL